jgi:predicted metalloprotease with PDZ domain
MYDVQPTPPLDWIAQGGYKLSYTDKPSAIWKANEAYRKGSNLSYSIGVSLGKDATVSNVVWGGPAYAAGLTVGAKIVAVDGRDYDSDGLKAAITAAKGGTQPIHLLISQGGRYRDVAVQWNGGLRYPTLEKVGKGEGGLDKLLAPLK